LLQLDIMKKVSSFLTTLLQSVTTTPTTFVLGLLVLLPILVLPLGENFLIDSKVFIILATGFVLSVLWAATTIYKKSLQITLSPFVLPLFILLVGTLLSTFFSNTLPVSQLFGWGGMFIAYVLTIIFGSSLLSQKNSKFFMTCLTVGAVLLSLTAVGELVNLGPSRLVNAGLKTQFPASPIFSLAGSPLIASQILILALVGLVTYFVIQRKKAMPFLAVAILPILAGLAVNIYTLYTASKTSTLFTPYNTSWSIAIESLKSLKSALIGVGPDTYTQLYLQFKPVAVNTSPYWNLQFAQGSNMPLTLLPTMGIIGLAAWLLLAGIAIRNFRSSTEEAKPIAAIVLASFVLQLLLPPNVVMLTLQALAILFWVVTEKNRLKDVQLHAFTVHVTKSGSEVQKVPQHSNLMIYVISFINAVLILFVGFWLVRFTLAQYFNFTASLSAIQNNPVQAYNDQQRMIQFNPYIAGYHRTYSNTNMAIAIALSNSTTATEQDKQQIAPLVQQAIREARVATAIEPENSVDWVNLARIYNNLIGVAEGAEQWSVLAYNQGQTTAPNDPILTLEVGGVLFRIGQYGEAAKAFEKTVQLKPDWANGYYSLANAYRMNKENDKAFGAYQTTLTLLQNNGQTEEYSKVKAELEALQKGSAAETTQKAPATPAAAKPAENLIAPNATGSTGISPEAKNALKNADLQNP
jgi:tetratricopeptide (TPR) repeat protein